MKFTYIKIESIQEEFKLSDEFFLKDKLIEFCIGLRKRILDIDVDLYSCECDETSEKLKTEKKEYIDFEKNIILLAKKNFSDSIFNEYFEHSFLLEDAIEKESCKEDVNRSELKLLKQKKHFFHKKAIDQIRWASELPLFYDNFDESSIEDKFSKIKLIMQYYDEEELERKEEILKSIKNNINSNLFTEIIMYVEVNKNTKRNFEELKSDIGEYENVKYIEVDKRMTYKLVIETAKNDADKDSVYLFANNDCFFDNTVNLLKKVNYQDGKLLVCMTRKDLTETGEIDYAVEPGVFKSDYEFESTEYIPRPKCQRLSIASQDAWAFTSDFNDNFDLDIELGTWNCEHFFCANAHDSGIMIRNVVSFVNCIHLHLTQFRRKYTFDNEITSTRQNNMWPNDENPRTNDVVINGTWRLRTSENYIDKNQRIHEYSEYYVNNFKNIC